MKIKICISSYGSGQLEYLNKVVQEFNSYKKHQVDIMVYTTVPVSFAHKLYNSSIGTMLTFACRQDMANAINDYDLFIYNENDMLITEDNIDAFLEHSATLDDKFVSGFLRYEYKDEKKILTDLNPHWGNELGKIVSPELFKPNNRHQGCWVLLKKDLITCIESKQFLESTRKNLEDGASDPYSWCGLTKVLPRDIKLCERLMIHHLPNKYIKRSEWISRGVTLRETLEKHIS
jgi:hypothetical protein